MSLFWLRVKKLALKLYALILTIVPKYKVMKPDILKTIEDIKKAIELLKKIKE
jgi:hypothetical protein